MTEDNPVRVVEVFVEQLDLGKLGFAGVTPMKTGRPAYHPAVLLKLYIYGYLNRIQSSRRLERESQRNLGFRDRINLHSAALSPRYSLQLEAANSTKQPPAQAGGFE